MNKVVVTGRLTKDIEVRYTSSQMAVVKTTVAVDRIGKEKETDFIPVTVFGKTAENMERFSGKGLRVSVEGHIQTGSYEKDGEKRFSMDVIAERVEFIDFKQKTAENANSSLTEASPKQNTTAPEPSPQVYMGNFEAIDEEIPF